MVILLAGFIGTSIAQESNSNQNKVWSFTNNPNPGYDELTTSEFEFLYGKENSTLEPCITSLTKNYQVYQMRYPDFVQTGSAEENFLNWKMHVYRLSVVNKGCITSVVWEELNNQDFYEPFDDFVFCGIYSRAPATSREIRVQKLLDELVSYTKFGSESAIFVLLALNEDSEFMKLNPDVEYYFSMLEYDRRIYDQPERDLHHLQAALNDNKRAFIEQAAKNYDLQAVLDQTAPCEAR